MYFHDRKYKLEKEENHYERISETFERNAPWDGPANRLDPIPHLRND
jgi:hypothetical protein